jgi:hypothetical protein
VTKLGAIGGLIVSLTVVLPAMASESLSLKGAMTKFGFIGEWAAQCAQPPSKENAHSHWSASSQSTGALFTDFGAAHTMSYAVSSAELTGADRIRLKLVDNQSGTPLELVIEMHDGHTRTLSSTRSDGTALIQGGKLVASGTDTVTQERCN